MGILDRTTADLDELTIRFGEWLRTRDPAAAVCGFRSNDGGAGYSNTTFFVAVDLADGPADLVVRVEPADPERALFPHYDIVRESRVVRALADHTAVPVPRCRWVETGPEVFGKPFLVMDQVGGDIPTDQPSYLAEGFVVDADDAARARMWNSSVDLLARLGRVDPRAAGLGYLADADGARAGVDAELDRWEHTYRWGRRGAPRFPEVERALRWLREHRPEPGEPALCWGDARLPNIIFRDGEPVCLIDWEIASVCAPEHDLAWFLLRQFDREQQLARVTGRPPARPGGFATDAETVARYEAGLGRPVRDLRYWWALNAFKTIAIKQRHYELQRQAGLLTAEQAEAARTAGGPVLEELLAAVDGRPTAAR